MADGPSQTIVFNGDSTGAVAALHAIDVEAKRVASALKGVEGGMGDGAAVDKVASKVKSLKALIERNRDAVLAQAGAYSEVEKSIQKISQKGQKVELFTTELGQLKTAEAMLSAVQQKTKTIADIERAAKAENAQWNDLKLQKINEVKSAELAAIKAVQAENAHYNTLKDQWAAANSSRMLKEEAALRAYQNSVKNAALEMAATGKSASDRAALRGSIFGIPKAEIDKQVAGLRAIENQIAKTNPRFNEMGMTAKGTAAALRQVPAQFTDIIVSLQGGQAPLTVLLQQGGQLKDVFGGVGNAARALGGYVLGLVNPITLAAAAIGTLGYAWYKGASETEEYNKALITTGSAAGVTAGQLSDMSRAVAQATGGTIGAAASALAGLAGSAGIASAQFEKIAAVAVQMEKVTGVAVAETVKQFAELGKEPLTASDKLNQSTHFLTASVYEQIKALEDQGRMLEAGALAQAAYADVLETRLPTLTENLGYIERAWKGIMGAAKGAWDSMANVGRPNSDNEIIDALKAKIANTEKNLAYNPGLYGADLKNMQTELVYLQRMAASKGAMAVYDADRIKRDEASISMSKEAAKYASNEVKLKREVARANADFANSNKTDKDVENYGARLRGLSKQYKDTESAPKKAAKGPVNLDPQNIAKAEVNRDIAQIKAESEAITGAYAQGQRIMDALYASSLVSDGEYYAAKRAGMEANNAIEEASLQSKITRLETELDKARVIGKNQIDIETKLIEARANLAKAKSGNNTDGVLLTMQQTAAGATGDKFFADQVSASDKRAVDMVEGVRVSQMSALDAENESYAARIAALTLFNAMRAEGEAGVNTLIEQEKALHSERVLGIEQQKDQMMLSAASGATSQMYDLLKQAGQEQSALGKVAFLATKALAVAQIILSTNVAAAAALALPPIGLGPIAGLPMAGFIKTMGYASAAMTAGLAVAEASAEGGYDIPGGVNPMTQLHEKEMVLPRAQANVIRDLAKDGGSKSSAITIVNNTSARIGKVTEQRMSNGERALIIEEAVAATAAQFSDPNSKTSRAMSRNYATQRSR